MGNVISVVNSLVGAIVVLIKLGVIISHVEQIEDIVDQLHLIHDRAVMTVVSVITKDLTPKSGQNDNYTVTVI